MTNICVEVGELTGMPNRTSGFDKTDPYVKLTIGEQVQQTRTMKDMGSKPVQFGEFLPFDTFGNGELEISVYDANRGKDELMAKGSIWLRKDHRGASKFALKLDAVNKHCNDPTLEVTVNYND